MIDDHRMLANVRASKVPNLGAELLLSDKACVVVMGNHLGTIAGKRH
jgi:hypothetical protein